MRWIFGPLAGCVMFWSIEAVAQLQAYGPDAQAALGMEKELGQIALDVRRTLSGMPNKSGVEYACVDSTFRGADRLGSIFSHYKFAIAIWYVVADEFDKVKAATILKIQTTQMQDEIRIVRERINSAMGTCSKFPLAIAKGTELLGTMRKADDAVKKMEAKL